MSGYFRVTQKQSGGGGGATITVSYSSAYYSKTITCSDGTTTYTATTTSSGSTTFNVNAEGTWTITCNGKTTSVDVVLEYEASMAPDGSTVLPTDDIQTWLECAGITDKSYTTLAEVLADSTTLLALMSDNNAVDYLVRSKTWIKTDVVPKMTSNTAPSGEVFASSEYDANYKAFEAFDQVDNTTGDRWTTVNGGGQNAFIGYHFTEPFCLRKIQYRQIADGETVKSNMANDTVHIEYSDDGVNYTALSQTIDLVRTVLTGTVEVDNDISAEYWRLKFTTGNFSASGSYYAMFSTLQFYSQIDHGITEDATAMTYIGANDYAADTLLADEDWREGIGESAYFESVLSLKVPTYASDNSNIISGGDYSGFPKYYVFDGNNSTRWLSSQVSPNYGWIGYKFGENVRIYKVFALFRTDGASEFKVEASTDGFVSDIQEIAPSTTVQGSSPSSVVYPSLPSSECSDYRIYARMPSASGNAVGVYTLQFYGREIS